MANLTLKIKGDITEVQRKIKDIKADLHAIEMSPIKIKVQATGLDAVTKEMVKYANAQAKVSTNETKLQIAQEKTKQLQIKLATQTEKTNTSLAKQAAQSAKTQSALKQQADATEKLTSQSRILGTVLDRTVTYALSAALRSIREAVTTLREVDQELTNIQKVSDLTAAEIKKIGDSAYDTASKYGVAANEYLEAVYTFQKAGLGDSAEEMAELATKVMLVGDTTSAVATKFLVSANAAWKLGGNIQALTKLVDEADYINNNYATTLEDIATGLPIVGAAAAQVGMSAEQTMAAIGTIVASTGQSASKAATALRAIIMNIIGQTGELEDGTKVTEETIKSFTGVLEKYAGEALAAARATGQILDPMEAVSALAKAAEDGFLNEAETFEVLAGLGGKLRTTQLTALVNAQEMYNKMLNGTATAAGTADREVGIMLESWNAKTQILKNTWTQFISRFVDSAAVKKGIDVATNAIKILDKIINKTHILTVAFGALGIALKAINGILSLIGKAFDATVGRLVDAFKDAEPMAEQHLKKAQELTDHYNQLQDEIATLNSQIEDNNTLIAKSNELIKQGNNVADNTAYVDRLKNENALLQAQIEARNALAAKDKEEADQAYRDAWNAKDYSIVKRYTTADGGTLYHDTRVNAEERARWLLDQLQSQGDFLDEATFEAYNNEVKKLIGTLEEYAQHLDTTKEDSWVFADALNVITKRWKVLNGITEDSVAATEQQVDATQTQVESVEELANALQQYNDAIDSVQSALSTLTAAQEEYNETGSLSVDTVQSLLALDAEYLDALIDENGQINLNSEAVSDLIDGKNILLERLAAEAIATYAVEEAQRMTESQYGRTGSAADTASSKMANAALAMIQTRDNANSAIPALKGYWAALYGVGTEYGMSDETFDVYAANVDRYAQNVMATLQSTSLGLGGWSSKGSSRGSSRSGSSGSTTDTELQTHKNRIDLLKQELSFLEASGASMAERVAKMREIQAALHDEAEYMRSIGADEKDILSVSTEWWKYQNDISKALEETKESYEDIKDAALARIDAEEARVLGPLQEQLENLKAQRDAMKDEREEEERLLEVEKARIALENAQKERNVRQYNAATGQWEWVANAANVSAAQENLAQAEQSLSDFYADRKIDELEAKIASIQNDYSQQRVIAEMQANSAAWFDADDATRKKLAAENLRLGTEQGWTRGADGVWYDANGRPVYDGGGILHGVGGIKATRGDEMVLPPNMTARLLTAEATGAFDALLNHLGIVTSAANAYAGFGGGITKNSIGEQHNGDTFYIDGVMMQNITESTTLGQLARTARTLNLCKGA